MSRLIKEAQANYQPLVAPAAYVGNPLIEALPKIFSQEDVHDDVRNFPRIAFSSERTLPKHERVHCVSAIEDLVIPLPHLFEIEAALSIMLRRGYAVRPPFNRKWRRKLFAIQEEMAEPLIEYQVRARTVPAMMITSVTGGGKTTLIESLLEMYPQVIIHTEYKGTQFCVKQLVWIRVNASFDASLKGLVLSLFGAVDEALGTTYRNQYENSKTSIDTMIGRWAQVVMTHHLGVLFVDEIQCLLLRGDDEAKLALSLFLKIGNVCRLPIIFGGTYSAVQLFSKVARNARRVCSGGYFDLELPRSHTDTQWDKCIVEAVWKYQWVITPANLDDALKAVVFDLTQGIVAILVALHRAAQVYAIRNDLKTVDAAVLRKVYQTQFVLLHPALSALKSKKSNRLEKFEDLLPPKDQLESLLRPTTAEARAETLEKLLALNSAAMAKALESAKGIPAVSDNELGGPDPSIEATDAANSLLKRIGENPELKELARQAGLIP
jgi:hypothetical protein